VEDEAAQPKVAGAVPLALGTHGESDGRVEVVMPDVDRLLSEVEVQEAMAAAMRAAMTAETTTSMPAPAGTEAAPEPLGASELPQAPGQLAARRGVGWKQPKRGSCGRGSPTGEPRRSRRRLPSWNSRLSGASTADGRRRETLDDANVACTPPATKSAPETVAGVETG
jgi:hypothetical protein